MESKYHFGASMLVSILWGAVCWNHFIINPWWIPLGIVVGTFVDVDHIIVTTLVYPDKSFRLVLSRKFDDYYYLFTHLPAEFGYPYWHTFTILAIVFVALSQQSPVRFLIVLVLVVHWLMDFPGMLFE